MHPIQANICDLENLLPYTKACHRLPHFFDLANLIVELSADPPRGTHHKILRMARVLALELCCAIKMGCDGYRVEGIPMELCTGVEQALAIATSLLAVMGFPEIPIQYSIDVSAPLTVASQH